MDCRNPSLHVVGVSFANTTTSLLKGNQMKPHKGTMLVVLLGLLLNVFAIGLAQEQITQATREAIHSKDSCCCKGDSCEMKEGVSNTDKKDGCCGCGDSCEMTMKEGMKHHADGAGCCCCGESCDMKMKEGMKNHVSDAGCCCCSAESCEMKKSEIMGSQSSAQNCCCSKMNHKNIQQMKTKQKAA
jgi:hypothetical protein